MTDLSIKVNLYFENYISVFPIFTWRKNKQRKMEEDNIRINGYVKFFLFL